ncbi:MAG: glycosyltransferase family 4 protein [Lachnospiraceae bacterium]|nr:glycosyltransferase family 4 protein [Lachnospiraceae bacterium]
MKKIYYLAYYSNDEKGKKRDAVPAADLQASYLAQVFSKIGYEVEIIAPNARYSGEKAFSIQKGFTKKINSTVTVRYFNCIESKYRFVRSLAARLTYFSAFRYIKKHDGIWVIYHSRLFYPYYHLFQRLRRKYILELEEIYSDVIGNSRLRRKEIKEVKKASAYILPSIPLAEEITDGKEYTLYHGSCRAEKKIGKGFQDGRIHVVYAGTFDPRVIGEHFSLIQAAQYLDKRYHIHIIGFGRNQADVDRIISDVHSMQGLPCKVSYDGLLLGDEYLAFLQSCHIGMFSKDPDGKDMNSSFPSKIMSYLGNGLRVVATRADSIETSEVGSIVYFCDSNKPEDVAKAIMDVDMDTPYDSRKELTEIENRLKKSLKHLMQNYKGKGE